MIQFLKELFKDYFAPLHRYGWWSVLIWIVVLTIATIATWHEMSVKHARP